MHINITLLIGYPKVVVVGSNNIPVNDMTALMSGLIYQLDKIIETKRSQSAWFVIAVNCQSGYSCHQQDKQTLEGCLCNQEDQATVQ